MSPRPEQRAPKGRHRDRQDRRAVLDVLLARAERGVITQAEGALLRAHVAEEMRLADENRRAMAGTTQALERHREAADAAIRELEQRAEQAEQRAEVIAADRDRLAAELDDAEQAADRFRRAAAQAEAERERLARAVQDMHDGINRTAHEAFAERKRHCEAEQATRDQYEQQLADARAAVARVRILAMRMRAGSPQGAAAIYADRIEQALDNDPRALDGDTEVRARILDRADSTEARLAEQQREHDVALAAERRNVVEASREAREQRRRADQAEAALDRVRALLPTEPRPTRGLPNGLAYEQGRHDAFDAVRDALDEHQLAPVD